MNFTFGNTTFGPPPISLPFEVDNSAFILYNKIVHYFGIYIEPALHCFGFVFNVICIIIFAIILKNFDRQNRKASAFKMFQCLLFKNICDFLINSFLIIAFIFSVEQIADDGSSFPRLIRYYFSFYLLPSFYLISASFDIIATGYCAISIEKKLKWLNKNFVFFILCFSCITFAFTFSSYYLICSKIRYLFSFAGKSLVYFYNTCDYTLVRMNLASNIFINITPICILLVINSYILFKLIQQHKRKRNITNINSNQMNQRETLSFRAKKQRLEMVICLFVLHFIGHAPNTIKLVIESFFYNQRISFLYFIYFSDFLFNIPYKFNIFIYFFFNNIFKETLLKFIKLLITKITHGHC
jgi:hypothetical protein